MNDKPKVIHTRTHTYTPSVFWPLPCVSGKCVWFCVCWSAFCGIQIATLHLCYERCRRYIRLSTKRKYTHEPLSLAKDDAIIAFDSKYGQNGAFHACTSETCVCSRVIRLWSIAWKCTYPFVICAEHLVILISRSHAFSHSVVHLCATTTFGINAVKLLSKLHNTHTNPCINVCECSVPCSFIQYIQELLD